jgi:hypothetical protein
MASAADGAERFCGWEVTSGGSVCALTDPGAAGRAAPAAMRGGSQPHGAEVSMAVEGAGWGLRLPAARELLRPRQRSKGDHAQGPLHGRGGQWIPIAHARCAFEAEGRTRLVWAEDGALAPPAGPRRRSRRLDAEQKLLTVMGRCPDRP